MMRILVSPRSFVAKESIARELLAPYGAELVLNRTGKSYNKAQIIELLQDIDGLIAGTEPLDAEVLEKAPRLKAISRYGVGLDNVDVEYAEKKGIKVMRAARSNSRSVAELAIALMFNITRGVCYSDKGSRKGVECRIHGIELTGKTLGLIGLGAIGLDVARMASGIGMTVLAHDPYIDETLAKEKGIRLMDREALLPLCDVISLHLPLTPESTRMVDEAFISKMKDGAYLVNTARGGLIDEDALYDALKGGKLAGAAADVFSKEPPDKEAPLLSLDNFILTGHIGAYTKESVNRMVEMSIKNLITMLFE
ncbi:MAG: phosphoglycerate dehydrogenase [Christensenellales bacterium]|jgi:D-3-phosphoglycerate dehydrogenase